MENWNYIGFKSALRFLPLVIPLKNLYLCYKITKINYSEQMGSSEQKKLEDILLLAGQTSLLEAFGV